MEVTAEITALDPASKKFQKELLALSGGDNPGDLVDLAQQWKFIGHTHHQGNESQRCQACQKNIKRVMHFRSTKSGIDFSIGPDCGLKLERLKTDGVLCAVTKHEETAYKSKLKEPLLALFNGKANEKKKLLAAMTNWLAEQDLPEDLARATSWLIEYGYPPSKAAAEALVEYYKNTRKFQLMDLVTDLESFRWWNLPHRKLLPHMHSWITMRDFARYTAIIVRLDEHREKLAVFRKRAELARKPLELVVFQRKLEALVETAPDVGKLLRTKLRQGKHNVTDEDQWSMVRMSGSTRHKYVLDRQEAEEYDGGVELFCVGRELHVSRDGCFRLYLLNKVRVEESERAFVATRRKMVRGQQMSLTITHHWW